METKKTNLHYVGSFSTLQTEAGNRLMHYGHKSYSPKQNELYQRLLLGLNAYTKEEVFAMNSTKKKRIIRAHKKAQMILNKWKQELSIQWTNKFFKLYFPESNVTTALLNDVEPDEEFVNTLSFRDLGIRKQQIVEKLLEFNCLPPNFASL